MEALYENDEVFIPFDDIINAVISRDLARLRELVERGHSIRYSSLASDNGVLHVAALFWTEHTGILEYLLSLDEVEKDTINSKGQTPLLICTKRHLKTAAEMLINAGADVTIADEDGFTPLHYSVRYNQEVSHKLILAGADINHVNNKGETPLHNAIEPLGDLEIICMLLYYGADTSIRTSDQYLTPFMLSLKTRKTDIAHQLFEYVTDFNLTTKDKWSTLFLAVRNGFTEIIDMCERGADINYDGNPDLNIFNLGAIPRPEVFRYLWPRFHCDNWPNSDSNILLSLAVTEFLNVKEVVEILQILFLNDNLEKIEFLIGYLSSKPAIYSLIDIFHVAGESEDMVHTLIACMLMCNIVVHELDLDMVYEHYGYCKAFKLLLYMDIQPNILDDGYRFNVFPSLIYKMSFHHEFESFILESFINDEDVGDDPYLNVVDYDRVFNHLLCLKLKRRVLSLCQETRDDGDDIQEGMRHLLAIYLSETPNVPLLKELARNKSRDFICEMFKIKTCCMFYTILDHLDLYNFVKQLVAFEKPLYKNDIEQKLPGFKNNMKTCRTDRRAILFEAL